jgi:glycosyltransferase involved in cell wall biosynthesis
MTTPAGRSPGTLPPSGVRCSIALCTYNGARHLPDQLDSIVAQTRRPDELVVSDDGSTDGSLEIVRDFAKHALFPVRVSCHAATVGVTKNFEHAIGLCEGDWIALSDQDDVWCANKLQVLESAFANDAHVGAVFADAEVVDEGLHPRGYSLWEAIEFDGKRRRTARRGPLLDVLLWRNVLTGATMAFRSDLRNAVLPIPDNWVHDAWIGLIAAAIGRVAMIEQPLIKYRQHIGNRIGAEKLTFSSRVDRVMRTSSSDYLRQLHQFEAVRERLVSLGGGPQQQDLLSQIERKMAHLSARVRMPGARWRRIPIVGRELIALNYHRYSSGWLSAFKDLSQSTSYRGDSTRASE